MADVECFLRDNHMKALEFVEKAIKYLVDYPPQYANALAFKDHCEFGLHQLII